MLTTIVLQNNDNKTPTGETNRKLHCHCSSPTGCLQLNSIEGKLIANFSRNSSMSNKKSDYVPEHSSLLVIHQLSRTKSDLTPLHLESILKFSCGADCNADNANWHRKFQNRYAIQCCERWLYPSHCQKTSATKPVKHTIPKLPKFNGHRSRRQARSNRSLTAQYLPRTFAALAGHNPMFREVLSLPTFRHQYCKLAAVSWSTWKGYHGCPMMSNYRSGNSPSIFAICSARLASPQPPS